jgi:GNAT superfamily N-acetyltransferase
LNADDVRHEAIAAMAGAYFPVPGQRVIDRADWFQVITPSVRHGSQNGIERAMIHDDVDATIDAAISDYRSIGCKFRWTVPPGSAPDDLGERLELRGLERRSIVAMARDSNEPLASVDSVTVERVTQATLDVFADLMAAGWGGDAGEARAMYLAAFAHQAMFLARIDGEPAGGAATVIFARSAYLRGGVVLPQFRGRGVYRALVAARVAACGRTVVTSAAGANSSGPILARMGFAEVARYWAYRG